MFGSNKTVTIKLDPHLQRMLDRAVSAIPALFNKLEEMMSKISDYAAQTHANYTKLSQGLDDIKDDIKTLDDKIAAFNDSPGTLSTEDQKTLDDLQAESQAIVDKTTALNDQHPNNPPAPPADTGATG